MKLALLVSAGLLAGCVGITSQDAIRMTPEQLTALVKDRNATAYCMRIIAAGYTGIVVTANLDSGTIQGPGKVVVNPDNCGMEIDTAPRPPAEPKPVVVKP